MGRGNGLINEEVEAHRITQKVQFSVLPIGVEPITSQIPAGYSNH